MDPRDIIGILIDSYLSQLAVRVFTGSDLITGSGPKLAISLVFFFKHFIITIMFVKYVYDHNNGVECACASEWRSCFSGDIFRTFFFFFVLFCFFVLFFYFFKISKFALPGVMLMYERTSKDRKKDVWIIKVGDDSYYLTESGP